MSNSRYYLTDGTYKDSMPNIGCLTLRGKVTKGGYDTSEPVTLATARKYQRHYNKFNPHFIVSYKSGNLVDVDSDKTWRAKQ